MADIRLERGAYAPYFRAAADPTIHRDKSVECSIDVKNTGNVTIPALAGLLLFFYVRTLSSMTGDCQANVKTWSDEADTQGGVDDYVENQSAIDPGELYTFTFSVGAGFIPVGLIDAGFVIALDTDGDWQPDIYTDCLLVKDAFEIVAQAAPPAPTYAVELGTPTFSEV